MSEQSTIGVYDTMSKAEDAVRQLNLGGYPIKQVSIVAQNLQSEREVHGFITAGDVAKNGAATGAWVGGLFGLLVGAAFVWLPGFGPLVVAGPLSAALLGGAEGAVAGAVGGGALGALVGWGVSKQHILKYEEVLKGGKYLVIAHGSAADVGRARDILGNSGASELRVHDDQPEPATQPAPEAALKGDYAYGLRTQPAAAGGPDFAQGERTQPAKPSRSDFAQGERTQPPAPGTADFARGQRKSGA